MRGIRLKKITKDLPDVIKEKAICFDNVRSCLTRPTRKLLDKKIQKLFEEKSLIFVCELVDNLHHYLGISEEVFRYDAEPCVICAGIQTLKEKLSSEEAAFLSEESFPVFESMCKQEEETCQK